MSLAAKRLCALVVAVNVLAGLGLAAEGVVWTLDLRRAATDLDQRILVEREHERDLDAKVEKWTREAPQPFWIRSGVGTAPAQQGGILLMGGGCATTGTTGVVTIYPETP